MNEIIYLIIGLFVGYLIGRNANKVVLTDRIDNDLNAQRAEAKQKHLDKILATFGPDDEITNNSVEHLLHVSNTSAERYLDELEKAGKLRQIGKTGKYVIYKKI